MADQPDKSAAKKKRRVKNPETFRERAQKAAEAGSKTRSTTRIKQAGGRAAGPVRRSVSRIYNAKPLAPLRKVLRIIGRIIFPKYFRQSWQELKLVTWPSWSEGRRLTVAVLVFAIVFGAAIAGVDWILDKVFRHLLLT
ncbi:MAG TPA: preprotein translocase subunit SecE [Candidatus Saccharimonadales bacterium]|nr:preprotein translocase subunit SecE [Candidatus Saccharimonadales bacterium]